VVFRLKRPAALLVAMLASGYSPVIPRHVPLAEHRARCVGTGPFKFKEWKRGQSVELVRNPGLLREGPALSRRGPATPSSSSAARGSRPCRPTRSTSLSGETTLSIAEQLKKAVPTMVLTETASNVSENLLLNTKKPPFDDVKGPARAQLRHRPPHLHPDRARGPRSSEPPWRRSLWGVGASLDKDLGQLPGYGGAAPGRAQARKLLAEAGFGPPIP
jgi:peptide/nickel transport system substrate-binding protein